MQGYSCEVVVELQTAEPNQDFDQKFVVLVLVVLVVAVLVVLVLVLPSSVRMWRKDSYSLDIVDYEICLINRPVSVVTVVVV